MTEKEAQAQVTLPIQTGTVNDVNLPWLLLCSQENRERRILCLGITAEEVGLIQCLLKYFTIVASCSFSDVSSTVSKLPLNVIVKHLNENISVLPYDTGMFDVVVICSFPSSGGISSCFFSEIYRVLSARGHLFFCFSNKLSYQRVKQLLRFTSNIKRMRGGGESLPHSVLSCENSLLKAGFCLPHFYTFSPSCNELSKIRDCNNSSHPAYSQGPFTSLKRHCVQFLKNTRFVRNYLATYYGVVASKRNDVSVIPSLVARALTYELQGAFWQVLGDTFDVTGKGTFVFKLFDRKSQTSAICKISLNQATRKHLEANYSALADISADPGISVEVKERIPSVIIKSEINGYSYFVEELKQGVPAVQYRHDRKAYDDILYESSTLITAIHNSTLVEDKNFGKSAISTKLELLRRFIQSDSDFIINLEKFLQNSLQDHVLFVATKGDCSANNIIVNLKKEISGIIDWDQAQKISFPMVDIINLIESFRRNSENKSMGQVVIEIFFEGKRSDLENNILKEYCSCLSLSVDDFIPFAVLYWIDHIIAQDFSSICKDKKWMQNNIILVINYLKKYI